VKKNSGIELVQVILKSYVGFVEKIQEKNGQFLLNEFDRKKPEGPDRSGVV
jgi:hypothetical protein